MTSSQYPRSLRDSNIRSIFGKISVYDTDAD